MSVKLKSITENSWLVLGDTEDTRIGLLTEIKNEYILMVKGEKQKFLNRKEVNRFFKEDIFKNIVLPEQVEEKTYFINGYPLDFDNPHEVVIKGNALPLFSKKSTSEVYYSAGYYCLHFPRNWMPAYCPKLETLQTYEYAGPFKDEFSMKQELTRLRKLKNSVK
jgi:hypothetical protein